MEPLILKQEMEDRRLYTRVLGQGLVLEWSPPHHYPETGWTFRPVCWVCLTGLRPPRAPENLVGCDGLGLPMGGGDHYGTHTSEALAKVLGTDRSAYGLRPLSDLRPVLEELAGPEWEVLGLTLSLSELLEDLEKEIESLWRKELAVREFGWSLWRSPWRKRRIISSALSRSTLILRPTGWYPEVS